MTGQAPANWYPDPYGRHELRFWDGYQWTHHISSAGRQGFDPPISALPAPKANPHNKKIERQVRQAGITTNAQTGGGTLFTEPVLVVNQKPKLVEVNAEYAIYNQHGQQVGAVREVGQSFLRNAIAPLPNSSRTHRLQIVDHTGQILMVLTRPATIARSKVIVRTADGTEIGQIVQKNFGVIGRVRFSLESGDQKVGSINAEGWDVWDFNIQDADRNEVARITKTWAGLSKQMSTKRDKYVVEIHRPLADPLRSLVLGTAIAIDTALRQAR